MESHGEETLGVMIAWCLRNLREEKVAQVRLALQVHISFGQVGWSPHIMLDHV